MLTSSWEVVAGSTASKDMVFSVGVILLAGTYSCTHDIYQQHAVGRTEH